jgi:polyvinyl alcohol dehydrogenase (cytochrome)
VPGDFAQATPAIAGDLLILGNQSGKLLGPGFGQPTPQPARVFAVNKITGLPVWVTQVDDRFLSFVTAPVVVANGTAFVGTASNEELVAAFVPKAYWTWQFRGSVVALDAATGAIKWKTYTIPTGYYGGAILGGGAIDLKSNQIFVSTGQNYWIPQDVQDCISGGGSPAACVAPNNHIDSVLALNMVTGVINWVSRALPYDAWSVACGLSVPGVFTIPPNDNCPSTAGPSYGFTQGPMLIGGGLVGAGQKNGKFWALDHKTGQVVWATQVAPGGITGGLQWGSATDGNRIFVAVANSGPSTNAGGAGAMPWTLKDGTTTTAGGWAALDRKTGAVLWTTKDPLNSRAEAAVSATDGVVFGCNLAPAKGTMYALNARTGEVLWSYDSGGPCNAVPSIADGMVFWGSGTFNSFGPKKVFAFGL